MVYTGDPGSQQSLLACVESFNTDQLFGVSAASTEHPREGLNCEAEAVRTKLDRGGVQGFPQSTL